MNGITTHILDTSRGMPAPDVLVKLEKHEENLWVSCGQAVTDNDGRARFGNANPAPGAYRLTFEIASYFAAQQSPAFYPFVQIVFTVSEPKHHHVPLLLSAFGYSTYRGS